MSAYISKLTLTLLLFAVQVIKFLTCYIIRSPAIEKFGNTVLFFFHNFGVGCQIPTVKAPLLKFLFDSS